MQRIATHHVTLPDGAAPDWLHVVPAGEFSGVDGRGPYRMRDTAAVIAASMQAGKLPVDECHSTDLALTTGQPAPARGWIVELQAREDGLWARVEWTPTGRQLMAEQAYRGVSPVFVHDKSGAVLRLLRVALTNTPNLAQLRALHQQQDPGMNWLEELRRRLSLGAEADEAAVLAAVDRLAAAPAAHAQQLARIATAAGVTVQEPEAIVTALQAQRAAASDATRMAQEIVSLQSQVATLRSDAARARATQAVDEAIRAGKPVAAIRDHLIARHMQDPAAVEKELAALPSLHAGGLGQRPASEGNADGLSLEDEEMIARFNLDREAFIKRRAAEQESIA